MGFVFEKGTYLRDGWNMIDFVVVLGGVSELFAFSDGKAKNITATRMVRLLRPLRSINTVKGIRVLVSSLIVSLPALGNVALFLLFIIILFATFGLHLFSGMFEWRCRVTEEPVDGLWPVIDDHYQLCNLDMDNCPAGSYCGSPYE